MFVRVSNLCSVFKSNNYSVFSYLLNYFCLLYSVLYNNSFKIELSLFVLFLYFIFKSCEAFYYGV